MFETRALQTPPELHAIAPAAYHDSNRCKANLSAMCVSPSKSELYVDCEGGFYSVIIDFVKVRVKISVNRYRSRLFCFYISKKYELWCRFVFLFTKSLQKVE